MFDGLLIVLVVLIQSMRSCALQGVRRLSVRKQSVSVDISPRIAGAIGSGFLAGAAVSYGLIKKGSKGVPEPQQIATPLQETANTSVEEKYNNIIFLSVLLNDSILMK